MRSSKVENILAKNKDARNNDRVLYIEYLKEYCGGISEQAILDWPSPATLTRIRADFQNKQGKYLATEKIRIYRKRKEIETRSWFSGFYKNIMNKIS